MRVFSATFLAFSLSAQSVSAADVREAIGVEEHPYDHALLLSMAQFATVAVRVALAEGRGIRVVPVPRALAPGQKPDSRYSREALAFFDAMAVKLPTGERIFPPSGIFLRAGEEVTARPFLHDDLIVLRKEEPFVLLHEYLHALFHRERIRRSIVPKSEKTGVPALAERLQRNLREEFANHLTMLHYRQELGLKTIDLQTILDSIPTGVRSQRDHLFKRSMQLPEEDRARLLDSFDEELANLRNRAESVLEAIPGRRPLERLTGLQVLLEEPDFDSPFYADRLGLSSPRRRAFARLNPGSSEKLTTDAVEAAFEYWAAVGANNEKLQEARNSLNRGVPISSGLMNHVAEQLRCLKAFGRISGGTR